jgi:4'-phosphopantetheinyl transferase EntD
MARLICDESERAWLAALPSECRASETLRLWTAKEALYKADPVQGDAIVAEYALAGPGDQVTVGGRSNSDHHATVTSLRHAGAVVSVALCMPGGGS